MSYIEAYKAMTKGYLVRRASWASKEKRLYFIHHSELCRAFEYGYGEYHNEPKFIGKIACINKKNEIHIGYKIKKKDRAAEDWELCGIWNK